MTDEEDAAPLRTRADVPPEMLRALSALKAEGPSRSSLHQVAARLGNLLDAPPPAAPSAGWLLRSVGARAVVLRVGMAVLAIGATAAWLRPSARERDPARTSAGVESNHDQPSAADDSVRFPVEGPSASTASEHESGAASAERAVDETAHAQHDGSGGRAQRAHARPARVRSLGATALSEQAGLPRAPSNLGSRTEEPRASTLGSRAEEPRASTLGSRAEEPRASTGGDKPGSLLAEQRAEAAANKPDAAVPPAVQAPPEPPSVRKLSEVELLLEARRLSVREPKAAQRLLDQHAVRFPAGVLAPEREVLAIEVLRALGQTAAAEQRLGAFRARYPNSMHLRRLSSPPPGQDREIDTKH